MTSRSILFRQLAAAFALFGVLLHGGLSGRHVAMVGPAGPLAALGAICFSGGSQAPNPGDATPATVTRSCPICTALAAVSLAPPAGDIVIEPSAASIDATPIIAQAELDSLALRRARARDPPIPT